MDISDDLRKQVQDLVAAGRKIDAIKVLRAKVDVSLGNAARLVDWIATGDPTRPPVLSNDPRESVTITEMRSGTAPAPKSVVLPIMLFVFLAIGLGGLGISAWLYQREREFQNASDRVDGIVVSNIRSGRGFRQVFEFTWQGKKQHVESKLSSSVNGHSPYATGEAVPLWVLRSDPTQAHAATWFGSWFLATFAGGMGALFTIVSLGVLYVFRRKPPTM